VDLETKQEHARRILERIDALRHPCDLDLLIFFARHPCTIMASEELAAFLGYELKQIAESLEVLLGAELLRRTQKSTYAVRMYVLAAGDSGSGWWPELLELASTRDGRLALRLALASPSTGGAAEGAADIEPEATLSEGPRPSLVQQPPRPIGDQDVAEDAAQRRR
jgi:hypothetical protein